MPPIALKPLELPISTFLVPAQSACVCHSSFDLIALKVPLATDSLGMRGDIDFY
jgi:hypothetical protein